MEEQRTYGSRKACLACGPAMLFVVYMACPFMTPLPAGAASSACRIVWVKKVPNLEITVKDAKPVPGEQKLVLPATVYDRDGHRAWQGSVELVQDKTGVWAGRAAMDNVDKSPPYRIDFSADRDDLDLRSSSSIRFAAEKDHVQWHGMRSTGRFPSETETLEFALNTLGDEFTRSAELEIVVRDAEQNTVFKKVETIELTGRLSEHRFDVTPDIKSHGPYSLEYSIVTDTGDFSFQGFERFAHATCLLPVSSMESDRLLDWFKSSFGSPRRYNNYAITFNSKDIIDPATFDSETFHSGSRSLRIDYQSETVVSLFSNKEIPGFPVNARVWVKGNGSDDQLNVFWRDRCEYARWVHERYVNRGQSVVCTLDFDGWREFTVPVLGNGLQTDSRHENPKSIAVPMYVLGFEVTSPKKKRQKGKQVETPVPAEDRTVWIDDLSFETQVPPTKRATLELRCDTPDHRLHPEAEMIVTVGNGTDVDIKGGRLSVLVRDRNAQSVETINSVLNVVPYGISQQRVSLAQLAAKSPSGPLSITVTFMAPSAGVRVAQDIVLKSCHHSGLFWDFETPEHYSGFEGCPGADTVSGGAEGSGAALRIMVTKDQTNAVILHPALPGIPGTVSMLVKGGAEPVVLRPVFLDDGATGVAGMGYNKLQTPDIKVDWQGWRRVSVQCPAVPPSYLEGDGMFHLEPSYPINMVLRARVEGDKPSEIAIDRVTVSTHLRDDQTVEAHIDYADETRVHKPGAPLSLRIINFLDEDRDLLLKWQLMDPRDQTVAQGELPAALPKGSQTVHQLVKQLPRGVYSLVVEGIGELPLRETLLVLDLKRYLGKDLLATLRDRKALEKSLGMTSRKVFLDWDNMEMVPRLFHYKWFHNEVEKASENGAYDLTPVVGFAADWAGPEKMESVKNKTYARFIGNYMQTPVRIRDWSAFVREAVREFKGTFKAWQFWENPDVPGFPAYIPPGKYREMLDVFHKWLSLYDPEALVVAGGFNYDKVFQYLSQMKDPDLLPFDRMSLQMNVGELSPEHADLEGVLDDLSDLLKLKETGRKLAVSQLDWAVGERVSPVAQGANHARASLIFHRRGAEPHEVAIANVGESFEGYGLFYRSAYGNSENVQNLRPIYVPKPSYVALVLTRQFLVDATFLKSVRIPDDNLQSNRAYVYRKANGVVAFAMWRVTSGGQSYRTPPTWKGATVADPFDSPLSLGDVLPCGAVPLFVHMPSGYKVEQLVHELRTLAPVDGRGTVLLALRTAEEDSCRRASYNRTGETSQETLSGRLPGGEHLKAEFTKGISTESFELESSHDGAALLYMLWNYEGGEGNKLHVKVNDGPEIQWDMTVTKDDRPTNVYVPGVRESSLILPRIVKGKNTVTVRYENPGNCAGYRVVPVDGDWVDFVVWSPLAAVQAKGEVSRDQSVVGTPLAVGKESYGTGLGSHAASFIEYPLCGQFSRFEVKTGIDASTDGKGTVVFKVFADGEERANSGLMNGFAVPAQLEVDELEDVNRLVLVVEDGGDGNDDDLADWVDGKLFLKK